MRIHGQRRFRGDWHSRLLPAFVAGVVLCGSAFGADNTPIVLQSLQFTPAAINTASATAHVTLTFTASDAASGINYFEASFVDPSGSARQSASAKFVPANPVTHALTITFPRFSNSGNWILSQVFLSDAAGNTSILNSEALVSRGFPTRVAVTSTKDTASPVLTGLSFSPEAIDTSVADAVVKVNCTATDDLSGVSYIELSFVSPSGSVRRRASAKIEAAQSASSLLSFTFPRFSEAGQWTLDLVFLADAAGNTLVRNGRALIRQGFRTNLTVRSTVDTTSPSLTSLRFTPDNIEASHGPAAVKVDFTATDDISGVKFIEVVFAGPNGAAMQRGSAVFPPVTRLTNSVSVNFPAWSAPGQWKLKAVLLADDAGNTQYLDAGAIAKLGLPSILAVRSMTDTSAPKLTSFRLASEAIDTSQGPATAKLELTATDDLSGVKSAEVVFVSPSGNARHRGSAVFAPAKEVSGSVEVAFPQSSERGAWKVASIFLADAAGNTLVLDSYETASIIRVR